MVGVALDVDFDLILGWRVEETHSDRSSATSEFSESVSESIEPSE